MKRFGEILSTIFEYVTPVFAALGLYHLFSCLLGSPDHLKILLYVLALLFAGFVIFSFEVYRKTARVKELEAEASEKAYYQTRFCLDVMGDLLTEEQTRIYVDELIKRMSEALEKEKK